MDSLDIGQQAVDTLTWVGYQVISVGRSSRDTTFGDLGTVIIGMAVAMPLYLKVGLSQQQFEELIRLIDKACSGSSTDRKQSKHLGLATLKRIASVMALNTASALVVLEKEIQQNLSHFLKQSLEVRVLLHKLNDYQRMQEIKIKKSTYLLASVRSHANNLVYSQMQMHAPCACRTHHLDRPRLRLEWKTADCDQAFTFELLFHPSVAWDDRGTSSHNVLWHATKIIVPHKKLIGQAQPETPSSLPPAAQEKVKKLGPGEFCQHIGKKSVSHLSFKIHEGKLRLVDSPEHLAQRNLKMVDGLSLAELLVKVHLGKCVKVKIAYIIAKSIWQYYNSYWMSSPWTHDDIYFQEEGIGSSLSYMPHPYFAAHLKKQKNKMQDFYTSPDLSFKYPYVLALGILLIEIATGNPFTDEEYSGRWDETQINDYFRLAWTAVAQNNLEESVDENFVDVLRNCLDVDLFIDAPFDENDPEKNLETRQSILYSKVVLPLEKLVKTYRDHWELLEMPQRSNTEDQSSQVNGPQQNNSETEREFRKPIPDQVFPASDDVVDIGGWTPGYWLTQIDKINASLKVLAGRNPNARPIKIAILDTGCTKNVGHFTMLPGEEDRLDGAHWYDWVGNEAEPVDEHGHGTALVTLMLRMVQNAEVFVARVAKSVEGLRHEEDNIAKAIIHAAKEWNVDIISMSFGFQTESVSIKNAIRKAEYYRKSSIVFFAAAGNNGANTQEMFPASMESVISVRATNSNGSFVDAYDPPPSAIKEYSCLYGTLGQHVPYDYADETLVKSGCSSATLIMAGITALMMEYYTYMAENSEEIKGILEQIRTQRGVIELFKAIAVKKGNQRFYVALWHLFDKGEMRRLSIAITAISRLPPQQIQK